LSGSRCVAVIGADRGDRAKLVAELLGETGPDSSALLLTASPKFFSGALGIDGSERLEIREDSQESHARAFAARLHDDGSRGPALLLRDRTSSLSESLGWEYFRRAAESGAWDLVIRELDGTTAALGRLEAPRRAAEIVELMWPRNVRFAALAAGENIDPVLLDAHEIGATLDVLDDWLTAKGGATPLSVSVAGDGEDAAAAAAMAALLGAHTLDMEAQGPPIRVESVDSLPTYRLDVSVPAEPDAAPAVIDGKLVLDFSGIRVPLDVGSVLARCLVHAAEFEPGHGRGTLSVVFVADRAQWPESMLARA